MKYGFYYRMLFAGLLITNALTGYSQGHNTGTGNDGKIAAFIRVWGFLKYYHPAVAKGGLDWDSVFISDLPGIRHSPSKGEFNSRLLSIINDLGPPEKDRQPLPPDTLFSQNHDMSWIDHEDWLNTNIRGRLKEIYIRRYKGANRYIKLKDLTADYSGEKKYEKMSIPEQDYRLLFLSRFWNVINYFAPYKYEIGEEPMIPSQLLVASKVLSVSPSYFFEQDRAQELTMKGIMSPMSGALNAASDRGAPR